MASLATRKVNTVMEIEGFDDLDAFLEHCTFDSVVPGICINPGCDYSTSVEPDCRSGYCEECSTQTVQSPLVLLRMI
jgi:hypothetical protein